MRDGFGLGPVFAFESIIASRKWQNYVLRAIFVGGLLAALWTVWLNQRVIFQQTSLQQLAALGESFFKAVVGTQLTLVMLAAPAATAGSICLDRARGTLLHLFVTDLSDREIVLGKLMARLIPVLALLACALPVMAILTLLGGVDPDAVAGAFLVTLGVAIFGCSLALVLSLWVGKTHEALLGTYAVWGLWMLGEPMAHYFNAAIGMPLVTLPERFSTGGPFALALAPYIRPGSVGMADFLWFLGELSAVSAILVGLAIWRLRPVAMREPARRKEKRIRDWLSRGVLGYLFSPNWLPGPSVDFNPVFWREWHRARPSRWARAVIGLYASFAVVFSVIAIFSGGRGEVAAWVNGFQVSIGLLLLSVTAATTLAEERVRGSLDVLLTTPLSTREIVMGKWLGAYRFVPALALPPALVVFFGGRYGEALAGALLTAAYVLTAGAAVTGLGLLLATWNARLGRAVGLTVACYVLVAVGWLFLMLMMRYNGPDQQGVMMGSPFMWAGQLAFEICGPRMTDRHYGWAVFWLMIAGLAALLLLAVVLMSFNARLGRVESGLLHLIADLPRRHRRHLAVVEQGASRAAQ